MLKVYLAGGMKSGWQDEVIHKVPDCIFLDPRSHGLIDENQYTRWDLEAIQASNLVFAYLEKTNPGGYALALELGYAKALGKPIILVDEKSPVAKNRDLRRQLGMLYAVSDYVTDSFTFGLNQLYWVLDHLKET